jgi:Flp pilus assembly protein protease CpaA
VIATTKQPWGTRRQLTRQEVQTIHAFHSAAFWMALFMSLFGAGGLLVLGFPAAYVLSAFTVMLAFFATVSGTLTDLMSMRIPDPITAVVLVAAVGWWIMEFHGATPDEGFGLARDVMGMLLPGQGSGSAVPSLDGLFPGAWLTLDILGGVIVFVPLFLSFILGMGFGGGDVKLMTALAFFLGWPLGFDFVILTFLFGGIASCVILALRLVFSALSKAGVGHVFVDRLAKAKTFAYAPAISLAALVCLAQKAEGFFQ